METNAEYEALMKQADEYRRRAQQVLKAQRKEVIAQVRATIKKYDITARELGFEAEKRLQKQERAQKVMRVGDKEWVVRPGRKPAWLREALERGDTIETVELKEAAEEYPLN